MVHEQVSAARLRERKSYFSASSALLQKFAIILLIAGLPGTTPAATFTWTGNGGSNQWGDAGNWTSILAPPTSPSFVGEELEFIFTGSQSTSSINTAWRVTRIEFQWGGVGM